MGSQEETRRTEWEEVRSNWESGDSQLSGEGENKREWSRDYIYTLKVMSENIIEMRTIRILTYRKNNR